MRPKTPQKYSLHIVHIEQKTVIRLRAALTRWYDNNGRMFPWRKESLSRYQKLVCEILLQRTRAETVASYYYKFFRRFPSWKALAKSNERDIARVLKPLGLYNQRASTLRRLAITIRERSGMLPRSFEEVEQLPGVGQYIANAVMLLCWGERYPLLDVNMARVLERVFERRKLADIRFDPYLQALSALIIDSKNARKINWAILDLAAVVCVSNNPRCEYCPLCSICQFYQES